MQNPAFHLAKVSVLGCLAIKWLILIYGSQGLWYMLSIITLLNIKKVSEYDQEIPQSQTADNPVAPRGRATQPSRDARKTNKAKQPALSSPSR